MATVTKTKAPTTAEMRRVVRAWAKANWPGVEHVELVANDRRGTIRLTEDVVGPPTDKAWFDNDHPETPEQKAEAEAHREMLRKVERETTQGKHALRKIPASEVRLAFISWWKTTENMMDNVLQDALETPGHPLYECLTEAEREAALEGLRGCTDPLTNGCPLPPFSTSEALLSILEKAGGA